MADPPVSPPSVEDAEEHPGAPEAPERARPQWRAHVPVRVQRLGQRFGHRLALGYAAALRTWRRSLQLRMVAITLLVSSLLVGAFGFLVVELTARNTLERARAEAAQQMENDAETARGQLRLHEQPNESDLPRTMRQIVAEQSVGPRLVALVPPADVAQVMETGTVPVTDALSDELVAAVAGGDKAWQVITADLGTGEGAVTYLAYGAPVPPNWGGQEPFQLYFLVPLTNEVGQVNDVRNTVLATGTALVVLLAVVTGLVTRLVVRPVRVAARTAQRLSAGLLDQRMTVSGEDELALLGASFNQMATNLQRQIVRLEEMSRLQRRFTSDVSHELRTPLTTVRMAADLIWGERDSYPPEVARSAELLQHELDRFESLLTDLLEISRFDAGFASLDSEPTDLVPVVRQAVDRLAAICARADTEVRVDLPEAGLIAEVDRRRVDRILRNLVENAVEHGEGRPVEVTLAAGEDAAAITVRDHGVGMRPEEQKLVFNRFWRADASRARQSGGTGLGLSISVEDARLHGGWLEAWGASGQGSQFRLTLPLRAGDRPTASPLPLVPEDAETGQPGRDRRAGDGAGHGNGSRPATGPGSGEGSGPVSQPGPGDQAGPGTGRPELTGTGVGP